MITTARLNDDERDQYEERAAIMEFDGKLPRKEAERLAMQELVNNRKENHV